MVKHGTSHGLSVLVCTIISAYLVEFTKPLLPNFFNWLGSISAGLRSALSVPISEDFFDVVFIASMLALLWGIFFKLRFIK